MVVDGAAFVVVGDGIEVVVDTMDDGEVGTLDADVGAAVVDGVALVCPELHSPRPRQATAISMNDATRVRRSRARTERTVMT